MLKKRMKERKKKRKNERKKEYSKICQLCQLISKESFKTDLER